MCMGLNDNDIKKALECCGIEETCRECPLKNEVDCLDKLNHSLLDLINRQQAEIERLVAECGNQSTLWRQHFESIFETAKETIKSEAIIQENDLYVKCAKNLLSTDYQQGYEEKNNTIVKCIDNLLEEKVGEQNA